MKSIDNLWTTLAADTNQFSGVQGSNHTGAVTRDTDRFIPENFSLKNKGGIHSSGKKRPTKQLLQQKFLNPNKSPNKARMDKTLVSSTSKK